MEAVLDIEKKYKEKKHIKRLELEYDDREYIIFNLEEKVIDVDGDIYMVDIDEKEIKELEKIIWEYAELDEYDYWPDKNGDHPPMGILWRISFYDEKEVYYHKSGVTKFPPNYKKLVIKLKSLKKSS